MLTPVARSSRHAITSPSPRILRFVGCLPLISRPCAAEHPAALQPHLSRHLNLCTFATSTIHRRRFLISEGRTTNPPDVEAEQSSHPAPSLPFYLETGYSIFAKRPTRPFPPPFISLPSGSFSEPLTTHNAPRGRRPYVNGQPVRGITNGDDAIIISDSNFIAVDDGVGAWAQKERGHAALWSRLIAHFWALEVEKSFQSGKEVALEDLNPRQYLEDAYEHTKEATRGTLKDQDIEQLDGEDITKSKSTSGESTSSPSTQEAEEQDKPGENDILGTTTASSALLHHTTSTVPKPVILATTLGDCKVLILRPTMPFSKAVLYRSVEQWHWFDCPRQLGTNSLDTPLKNAVTDTVEVAPGDIVAVLSDGVTDNLWEHEIAETICACMAKWAEGQDEARDGVVYVARTLMNAAREVAQDPYAESPYMERALDEGLAAEGGKLDDISVVLGVCRKRE